MITGDIIEMWTGDPSVLRGVQQITRVTVQSEIQVRRDRQSIMLEGADERLLGNFVNEQLRRAIIRRLNRSRL